VTSVAVQSAPAKTPDNASETSGNSPVSASGSSATSSTPSEPNAAPTVLTPGGYAHHKKHHVQAGQLGHVIDKRV
jgi:hypothetical protein